MNFVVRVTHLSRRHHLQVPGADRQVRPRRRSGHQAAGRRRGPGGEPGHRQVEHGLGGGVPRPLPRDSCDGGEQRPQRKQSLSEEWRRFVRFEMTEFRAKGLMFPLGAPEEKVTGSLLDFM